MLATALRKYSNFVGFPIVVDGERVNAVEAIWGKSKSEVTEEEALAAQAFLLFFRCAAASS